MKIARIIGYKKLFSIDEMPSIASLLLGIPSSAIIDRMAFFSARLIGQPLNPKIQKEWLIDFLSNYPENVRSRYENALDKLERENIEILIFTVLGCLLLTEYAIKHFVEGDYKSLSKEEELNIINSFLILNELFDEKQAKKIKSGIDIENANIDSYLNMLLLLQFPQAEFFFSKDVITQSLKCKLFFEWMETDEKMSRYFKEFLIDNNVSSWNEYLFFIWNIYASLSKLNNEFVNYQSLS